MATDVQRQRVYNWERRYIPRVWGVRMDEQAVRALMAEVAQHYGFTTPSLELKYMRRWAGTYYHWGNKVTLNPGTGMNRGTVLHEMAHAVARFWADKVKSPLLKDGGHGDYFMAAYVAVLRQFGQFTPEEWVSVEWALDPNNFHGSTRRDIPRVACCAVGEDPVNSADQSRRAMKCMECNYPWIRHDMPFHKHECAERWLTSRGFLSPPELEGLRPAERRARVVERALLYTKEWGWIGRGWFRLATFPDAVPFRPTIADHAKKAAGQKVYRPSV